MISLVKYGLLLWLWLALGLPFVFSKILFKSGLNFTQGTRCPLLKAGYYEKENINSFRCPHFSFSHAESWESITKSTYQSSAYAESKQITNQDGSKTTVYYIDAAMQASACQGAKSSAQSVFTQVKPTYEGIWPDSEFRLVFTGDCTYSDSPGRRINIGL